MQRTIQSLDQMIDGAVHERFEAELVKVWANIYDPNTDPKAARSITLTFKFNPNERRDSAEQTFSVSSKLAPPVPIVQTILIEQHDDGTVTATERTKQIPGQMDMDGNATVPHIVEFGRPKQ